MSESLLKALMEWCDDRVNPIFIRIVRQRLRSRGFMGIFIALLLLVIIATLFFIRTTHPYGSSGASFFGFLTTSWLFLVTMQASRTFSDLTEEAQENSYDLIKISQINPIAVMKGHIYVGLLYIQFYGAVLAPFIVMSYLLGGVDLGVICFILVAVPFVGLSTVIVGIFCGAFAAGVGGKGFFRALLFLAILFIWLISSGLLSSTYFPQVVVGFLLASPLEMVFATGTVLFIWSIVMFALLSIAYDCINSKGFPAYHDRRVNT